MKIPGLLFSMIRRGYNLKRVLLIFLIVMVIGSGVGLAADGEADSAAGDKADSALDTLPEPAYQTLEGQLYDIGTGEIAFLVFSTGAGDYLVASASYGKLQNLKGLHLLLTGRIKELDAGPFLGQIEVEDYNTIIPGRPERSEDCGEANLDETTEDCDEANLDETTESSNCDDSSSGWQKEVAILGRLVAAEDRLFLLSRDQLVVELLSGDKKTAESGSSSAISSNDSDTDTVNDSSRDKSSRNLDDFGSLGNYIDEEIVITGKFRWLGDYSGELEVKSYRVLSE